ncbi:SurA N-terminal domain-containing protein [Rhizobium rhizogenes]|uniref:Molecular chaperone SurA n=1 Tax=Rhizobium rhizogenes TaxID=359 RepID=A0AA92C195_RHIRH|nr:SurA N-terminal domain-containing protein [Rhizobium rhizogenes]PVE51929.1 molecular chaperone SurA [Rhizobium rhizogenes]PVE64174.1 molecular chaperone SurA [Agrobacterium tumefaciens]PVE73437.1 molecular chaperone SurA [Sphingomonas sp. TPD3009]
MNFGKKAMRSVAFAFAIFAVPMIVTPQANVAFADSAVKIIVNKTPITSDDIARRVAFLKLQRQSGNLNEKAREQLIEEALKREEIARVKASVSTADVDAAFGRFAASNKLTKDQLTKVLTQAGVGADHFKSFIAVQMSWPRLVNARYGGKNRMSTQDFITRLKERGQKPVTSEYFLQQIIFVVPESKKSIIGKRKSEAEASRKRYPGCEQAKTFAATMLDVSIKDLGRILEPELPTEWKDLVTKTPEGGTTATRVTEKGVEYLAVCKKQQVSDDYAAEVVFRAEDLSKAEKGENPNEKKYLDELRSKAQITQT